MLLLLVSATSWASELAWLPEAPPKTVPLGKVIVCGAWSPACIMENCCGWPMHPPSSTAVTTLRMLTLCVFIMSLSFCVDFARIINNSSGRGHDAVVDAVGTVRRLKPRAAAQFVTHAAGGGGNTAGRQRRVDRPHRIR